MRFIFPLATILLLAACTAPRPVAPPAPVTVATPALPPPPKPAAVGPDRRDWPPTPGVWSYRRDSRGSIALFGPAYSEAMLVLRCDRAARMLYLSRAGDHAATLTLRTTSLTRMLNAVPTDNAEEPFIAVAITPGDPLLDAMGFSRGHFVLEQSGMPPLVVPAWAEIERVTEDCRG
ncbi:hypothetical protein [uncultured Sphingomonas sp.]|uniref:hypothetical protein n=1 Tax=uncultured Sphingomonas sp. TaxID=158754 RepID=UPI0035C9DB20